MTALIAIALAAPILLWSLWRGSIRVVYSGPAKVVTATKYIGPKRGNLPQNAFVSVAVPGLGWLLAEIRPERASALPENDIVPIEVEVCRGFAGKPFVQSVKWPGSDADKETATINGAALLVAVVYLLAGVAAIVYNMLTVSEVALICSGFVCGWSQLIGKKLDRRTSVALIIPLVLLGICSVALFSQPSILVLFPGIAVAFSFGQVGGMLAAGLRKQAG